MEIISGIENIIRMFFDNDSITINEETKAADIEGWDSLANVQIMLAIEAEYGVEFSLDEMVSFKNVGDIADCISRHIN